MNAAPRQPTPATPLPTVIRYRLRYPAQVPFAATRPVAMNQIVEISKKRKERQMIRKSHSRRSASGISTTRGTVNEPTAVPFPHLSA
jgi:hypothetical protein